MKGALVFEGGRPAKGKEGMRDSRRPRLAPLSPPTASAFLHLNPPSSRSLTHGYLVFWSAASLAKTVKPSVEASLFFPRPGASASGDRIYTGFLHEEARRGEGEQPPPADRQNRVPIFREIFVYLLSPKMNPAQGALRVSSRRFGRACPTLRAMGAPGPGSGIWRPREIETGVFKWGYRYIGFFASILPLLFLLVGLQKARHRRRLPRAPWS